MFSAWLHWGWCRVGLVDLFARGLLGSRRLFAGVVLNEVVYEVLRLLVFNVHASHERTPSGKNLGFRVEVSPFATQREGYLARGPGGVRPNSVGNS